MRVPHRALAVFALAAAVVGGCQPVERKATTPAPDTAGADAVAADTASAPLLVLDWSALRAQGRPPAGALAAEPNLGFTAVRVENATDRPRTFHLATLDAPGIEAGFWALRGQVRCTAVYGKAYVEMLHRFPDGETLYARTIAREGPEQALMRTAPWRPFALSFRAHKPHRPWQIVVSVVLPQRGIIELGPMELYQGRAAEALMRPPVRPGTS